MTAPPRRRLWLRSAGIVAAVGLVLGGTQLLRRSLGIEWSAESIQSTVAGFGIWAPVVFVALVCVRQLMALPSVLVLTSAGLLFGAGLGTLLGGVGIALNACVLYGIARFMGRDWVLPRIHARWPQFEIRARTAGPPFLAITTAHPWGVLTPFYFAAGVTGITAPMFLLSVGPAALVRAGLYSYLGANLMDVTGPDFWIATTLLVLAGVVPFAHPGLRRRLRSLVDSSEHAP